MFDDRRCSSSPTQSVGTSEDNECNIDWPIFSMAHSKNCGRLCHTSVKARPIATKNSCRVLEAIPHPKLPEEVGNLTVEFLPHEVDGPRAAVGNEYRKIQAIIACLDKQDEWELNRELSQIAVNLKYALVNSDWLRHPPLRRATEAVSESADAGLERAVIEFVESFEAVFHYDWSYTCWGLGVQEPAENEINQRTFLEPGLTEYYEFDDWGNRGRLLQTYRKIASVLMQRGFRPVILHPRKEDWLYGDVQLTRAWRDEPESTDPTADTEPHQQLKHSKDAEDLPPK